MVLLLSMFDCQHGADLLHDIPLVSKATDAAFSGFALGGQIENQGTFTPMWRCLANMLGTWILRSLVHVLAYDYSFVLLLRTKKRIVITGIR